MSVQPRVAARAEEVIDPHGAVVDPHHHLWDRGGECYDLAAYEAEAAAGHPVSASLYVECQNHYLEQGPEALRCVGETRWVVETLERAGALGAPAVCRGLLARADLALGARVQEVLAQHLQAGGSWVKGWRFCAAWDASGAIRSHYPSAPDIFERDLTSHGLDAAAGTGLALDLWVYFHQLPAVERWLRQQPDALIVLDHCGGPIGLGAYAGRRDEVLAEWAQGLRLFADRPRVHLKFGGLAMPLAGFGWHRWPEPPDSQTLAAAWRPYFEIALDVFGPGRMMFESNFPVDRSGCAQVTLWNAFKRLCAGLSAEERRQLLGGTASDVYRLH